MSSSEDRRESIRDLACFPVGIEIGEQICPGLVRDVSVTGARLFTQASLAEGDRVCLSLYIFDDPDLARVVTGRLVRVEQAPTEPGFWPCRVGVAFDEPIADCESEMMDWAQRNADVYGEVA